MPFCLRNKTCSPCLNSLGEFKSRSVKTRDAVESFSLLENSHKLCRVSVYQAKKTQRTCFKLFYKIIISPPNKKKYDIRSANIIIVIFLL